MTYALDFALDLGVAGFADLRAQLVDTAGANVGAAISAGFVDQASGYYQWHASAIPNGHQGGVKFYRLADPTTTLAFQAINPQIDEAPAQVWAYAARTLTQTAQQIVTGLTGSAIAMLRGDTFSVAITGLGDLTGYTSLDFTVKISVNDSDNDAIVRIRKNASGSGDGLLRLNGVAVILADATKGSIAIDDLALGNITVTLDAGIAAQLVVNDYVFDIQEIVTGAPITTLTSGLFSVLGDVTRAVT